MLGLKICINLNSSLAVNWDVSTLFNHIGGARPIATDRGFECKRQLVPVGRDQSANTVKSKLVIKL